MALASVAVAFDVLTADALNAVAEIVAYAPSSPTGLVWAISRKRAPIGGIAGSPIGKTGQHKVQINGRAYPCHWLVLALNGHLPRPGEVVTRVRPGDGWGQVENLRWCSRAEAAGIAKECLRVELVRSVFGGEPPQLPKLQRFGELCQGGHTWNGYRVTVYSATKGGSRVVYRCLACKNERQGKWYQENAERERAKARERMAAHYEKLRREQPGELARRSVQSMRRHGRRSQGAATGHIVIPGNLYGTGATADEWIWLEAIGIPRQDVTFEDVEYLRAMRAAMSGAGNAPTVAELVADEQRRYWDEHPDERIVFMRERAKRKQRFRTMADNEYRIYHREKSKRRKAWMALSGPEKIRARDIRTRFLLFDDACAYCGEEGDMQIEHVIPRARGGAHVIENIAPACCDCNYSKRDHPVDEWYRRQPFFDNARWLTIQRLCLAPQSHPCGTLRKPQTPVAA